MMNWDRIKIFDENNKEIEAQAPLIISASRSTDIPAFYADWFIERYKKGYVKWKNPFSGTFSYVSFKKTRVVVFWSKNPKPLYKYLDFLDENIKNYYLQYTLNDYEEEKLEGKVQNLETRIDTFIKFSEKIGKERVIWRFDPLMLTDKITVDELLKRIENIGDKLKPYTSKFVFSYADIKTYKKVENNLIRDQIRYREFDELSMNEIAAGIKQLNSKWGFEVGTCAENIDLAKYGIIHNKCIDDELMIKLFRDDKILMDFLGVKEQIQTLFDVDLNNKKVMLKDKGQREACGCIMSKDIGEYNTCPHECVYCYANTSKNTAMANYKSHREQPLNETITGKK